MRLRMYLRLDYFSMKIRLMFSFACVLLFFMAVAMYNLNQVGHIKKQISYQNNEVGDKLLALELKEKVQELDVIKSGLMISKDSSLAEYYNKEKAVFNGYVKKIGDTASTKEERDWRAKLQTVAGEYTASFDTALEYIQDPGLTNVELEEKLARLYSLSQAHKKYIFDLIDKFNVTYSASVENAKKESDDLLNNTAYFSLMATIAVFLVTVIIAFLLYRSFIEPIQKLRTVVQLISEGDLTHGIYSSSKDELGQFSRHFDQMVDKVRSMLGNTKTIASSLTDYSHSFQSFSITTAAANADILKAIDEISAGADQQALHSEQSTLLISELEQEIDEVTSYTGFIRATSTEAKQNTRLGAETIESLRKTADLSEEMLDKLYGSLQSLAQSSSQIAKITNTITEISNQTHVLALNAAIEAARAGVHGKGFSVIANEVRQLSQQTNDSSKHIAQMIKQLMVQMEESQENMLRAKHTMNLQGRKVTDTLQTFQSIHISMEQLSSQIDQIHLKVDLAKEKNKKLVQSVQHVASIAEETAAGVQEVNSTSSHHDAAIRQIAEQAAEINNLSQQLFAEINKFQVKAED